MAGVILSALLKQRKTNALSGSPASAAAWSARCDRAVQIVHLVGIRQTDNAFRIVGLGSGWNDPAVGKDVIHIGRARRTSEAEIIHLNRCWPARQDAGPRAPGVAIEVDQNVDLFFIQNPCGFAISKGAGIDEFVKCRLQPSARGATVTSSGADAYDLELRAGS